MLEQEALPCRYLVFVRQTNEAHVGMLCHLIDPYRGELGRHRIRENVLPDGFSGSELTKPLHYRAL